MPGKRRTALCAALAILAAASAGAAAAPEDPQTNSLSPVVVQHPINIARPLAPSMRPQRLSPFVNAAGVPQCSDVHGSVVTCSGSTMLQFSYFGGKVIPNAKVYAVFWTSAVDSATQSNIGPFYQAVTNSGYMDWLTEYSTTPFSGGSNQLIGRGTYGGASTITPTTLPHTCVPNSVGQTPPAGTVCIWDTDIPNELDVQITAGTLPPPDQHALYMLHFPPTYVIQSFDRTFIQDSCVQYCAFHSTYTRVGFGSVYYGVLPDPSANGCQLGCGSGNAFQNLCSSASHELGEAVTDAEVGLATVNAPPLGWYDGAQISQGEIGDMCNQVTDTLQSFGGTTYTVQDLFSKVIWDAVPQPTTPACVSNRFATKDYKIYFNPNTQSIASGGNVSIPIHLETTNGAPSSVTLAVSNASTIPSTVHPSLSRTTAISVAAGSTTVANLNVAVDLGALAAGDQLIVVNATSGALVHTAAVLLQVVTGTATASSNSPVCAGSSIMLSTPTVTGTTYAWTGPNGFTSTQQNPIIANATSANAGSYTVTVLVNKKPTAAGTTVIVVTPSLGMYPTTFIAAGGGKTVAPSIAAVGSSVSAAASVGFTGALSVNSTTGVVTISNAGPAGTSPTITITASDQCGASTMSSFVLVISAFTDDPLVAAVTTVKAVHLNELRNAIRAAATVAGQNPTFTDDPLPSGAAIKAVHIRELRTALTNAFIALHLIPPAFTDPTLTPGVVPVKAVHFQELRNAMK
jgi:hypothetical protein